MKIVFMGTPVFAVRILESLIDHHHDICLVVTQPDKPVGRKKTLEHSPVKQLALRHKISVFQPVNLKKEYQTIVQLNPDLIITAAYGQMLPNELLNQLTAINVHGSLLPAYRGGAPIQHALFDGLEETGVTIMYMAHAMDSGDIIKQEALPILPNDNYQTLSHRLSHLGAHLLNDVLEDFQKGLIIRKQQDNSKITYALTLKYQDEYLDFNQSASQVINRVRGLSPEPGAHTSIKSHTIKIYNLKKSDIIDHTTPPGTILEVKKRLIVQTKDTPVEILELQIPGKKKMQVKAFLNGQNIIQMGDVFKGKEE
ncbi:MAG: methionyl-tRNA formyltransferase [Acholeplasmataceae bacterium]|nr:methionyl-tRNA formyltransferase [Acholeplasmataceae bacterium]